MRKKGNKEEIIKMSNNKLPCMVVMNTKKIRIIGVIVLMGMSTPVSYATPPSLGTLEASKTKAKKEAEDLQKQVVEKNKKLTDLSTKLTITGEKKLQAEKDLEIAKKHETAQRDAMQKCIVQTYENGGKMHMFENILKSKSINQIINRSYYATEVQKHNNKKLKEYVDTKKKIETLQKTLKEEESALTRMQKESQEQEDKLNKLYDEKKEELKELESQIQEAIIASSAEDVPDFEEILSTANDATSAEKIVAAAYTQLGVPYVWGGTSPGRGLDCSGLVQYCYRQAGIGLPRVSQSQGCCGSRVSKPEPGDMVCYGHHIAIYIGNGKMIHAPHPGDYVRVAPVYGSPWFMRAW